MSLFRNTFFPHPFLESFLFISGVYFSTFSFLSIALHFHTHFSCFFYFLTLSPPFFLCQISLSLHLSWGLRVLSVCLDSLFPGNIMSKQIMLASFPAHKTDGERKQDREKHKKVWLWCSQRRLYSEATERKKIKEEEDAYTADMD